MKSSCSPPPVVSVIIRTHKFERLPLVKRALRSLCVQQGVLVEPIIISQRFSELQQAHLEAEASRVCASFKAITSCRFEGIGKRDNEEDLRAIALNVGIKIATGRYLAFLDDDDLVYHFAYRQLIDDLSATNSAVAFGRCVRVDGEVCRDHIYAKSKSRPYQGRSIFELFTDNFSPIHSFLLDREIIAATDLLVDSDAPYIEDYRLLLRLAAKYKMTFLSMEEDICEYWMYSRGENTTTRAADRYSDTASKWRQSYEETEKLKSTLSININILDIEMWMRRVNKDPRGATGVFGRFDSPTDTAVEAARAVNSKLCLTSDWFHSRSLTQ